jgi:hypothetical protein
MSKKKYTKPENFPIREKELAGGCACKSNGIIFSHCLNEGICPSLKIIAVFEGYLLKEKPSVRKEKLVVRKIDLAFK